MTATAEPRTEPVGSAGRPARSPDPPTAVWNLRLTAVCVALMLFALAQNAGAVAADTKLDLVVAPVGMLQRALHLWDPLGYFGQLQNQGYGYLFPMGPFFLVGHLLALPVWVLQRLWQGALLVTAFLGVVRVARRLGIGTPASQIIAGLAYALSPRMMAVLGVISSEALPMAVAPWVLLPLLSPR